MGLITDAKAATDIVEVLERHVKLRKEGRHLIGRCPFHDDRGRPNLVVYPTTQTFKCFACGAYGDAVDFIARIQGVTLTEAARRLKGEDNIVPCRPKRLPGRRKEQKAEKASPKRLDEVYRALMRYLGLSLSHRDMLLARGFPDELISGGYASLGEQGRSAAIELLSMDFGPGSLRGVPGFFVDGEGFWKMAGPPGLLVPSLDLHGCIAGMQIRVDHSERGKYLWLSTPGKSGGASSGAPYHVCGFYGEGGKEVWVTEGALKAAYASWRMERPFVAASGVSTWRSVMEPLKAMRPRRVVIAFDQDDGTQAKEAVSRQRSELIEVLEAERIAVAVASWEGSEKGIDDALRAGRTVSV